MIKCIFDSQTGQILAFVKPQQDFSGMLAQWPQADWIEIQEQPRSLRNFSWSVDLTSRTIKS